MAPMWWWSDMLARRVRDRHVSQRRISIYPGRFLENPDFNTFRVRQGREPSHRHLFVAKTSPSDQPQLYSNIPIIFTWCNRTGLALQPACIDRTRAYALRSYVRAVRAFCFSPECQTDQAAMSKPRCWRWMFFQTGGSVGSDMSADLILVKDFAV
jgi:hypothetical protein